MRELQKINWLQIDTENVPSMKQLSLGTFETPIDKIYARQIIGFNGENSGFTSANGAVFITNIVPNGDGNITNVITSSDGLVVDSFTTNIQTVRVFLIGLTGVSNFKPKIYYKNNLIELDGNLTSSIFSGYTDINLNYENDITLIHEDGTIHKTAVFYEPLPIVENAIFYGDYPNGQTELKENDTYQLKITGDTIFNKVEIIDFGALKPEFINVPSGLTATITVKIANRGNDTNNYGAKIKIIKPNNSKSEEFYINGFINKVNTLFLNNQYPTITFNSITYPNNQQALKNSEDAIVTNTVEFFDTIEYISNEIRAHVTDTYSPILNVTRTGGTYNITTNNLIIRATKTSNNAITTGATIVNIAHTAPTVTIGGTDKRLISGGNDNTLAQTYTITINSDQKMLSIPSMSSSVGIFEYNYWTYVTNKQYFNILLIHDNMPRGTHYFNNLTVTNLAGINVTTPVNNSYIIGGFVARTVNLGPNDSDAIINVQISDYDKVPTTLNWSFKQLPIKKPIGTTTKYLGHSWSVMINTDNTIINILDTQAVDSSTKPSTITINEIS